MARTPSLHLSSSTTPSPSCTWNINVPLSLDQEDIMSEQLNHSLLNHHWFSNIVLFVLFSIRTLWKPELSWLNKFPPSLKVLFHFCPYPSQLFSPLHQLLLFTFVFIELTWTFLPSPKVPPSSALLSPGFGLPGSTCHGDKIVFCWPSRQLFRWHCHLLTDWHQVIVEGLQDSLSI